MKTNQLLLSLGLSEVESTIYLAMLNNGTLSIRQLASDTGVNRGSVYESLQRLTSLGLVSFTRTGERRKYVAERASKIHDLIAERKHEVATLQTAAADIVPQLMARGEQRTGEPTVRFYEDDEGIVTILRDVLNTAARLPKREYQVYSSRPMRRYIYRRFPSFTRRRIAEQVFVRTIAVGSGGEPAELSERRWLAEPTEEQLSSYVIIYGHKLALVSVSPDDTPYGVIIEEPGVAAMQRFLFNQLWNTLPDKE